MTCDICDEPIKNHDRSWPQGNAEKVAVDGRPVAHAHLSCYRRAVELERRSLFRVVK